MRPPEVRICFISSAIAPINTFLGFSAETSLAMNVKISVCRDRSSGVTRTPWWPTTTSMPGRAPWKTMQRARPALASTVIAQSISMSSTGTHVPSMRTSVGRLLVE